MTSERVSIKENKVPGISNQGVKKHINEKTPNGADLLATLIKLLADQEGVKITYEIIEEAKVATNAGTHMAV